MPLKNRLRTLLGDDSPEWRLLHRLHVRVQRLRRLRPLEPAMNLEAWIQAGKPVPPPHAVKERILAAYASAFGASVLIETGTYAGDMVSALKDRFEKILSIELSEDLARRAQRRFRAFPHIRILQGDSGEVLPRLLAGISGRCLFWLDGHYSAGVTAKGDAASPAMRELQAILERPAEDRVILIDDARLFRRAHDFPELDRLRDMVERLRPDWDFSVRNDVVRIHPRCDVPSEF
jgi:hypothetical protein